MICLILARGGSKGIPKKNIKNLDGKPLIEHVIESARNCDKIDDIFVSTDCEEIANTISKLNVKIIERPEILASDSSPDIDSFIHFLSGN